ncbi:Mannosyltransferase OCH1 and related enzymes [Pseudomonas sp. LAMO17WK12:I10]|nr:glycosyl transferase-like sugar-binding protein [Pseudomonas sp. LAMO17WK12:I9]SNY26013.1 Mannosyltransferase OCH1 and related enzymes [Pseudomonas sp. LAMO17WK12:I10]
MDWPEHATASALRGEPVPMEAHYVWEGGNIPKSALRNILYFKETNPDYTVNIWTSRPMAIESTWNALMDNESDAIGRHLATRALIMKGIRIRSSSDLLSDFSKVYPNSNKVESIVEREKNGPYKNYASASDIIRLVILYTYGGLYMDADVAVGENIGPLSTKTGIAIHQMHEMTSNGVMASTRQSRPVGNLLDGIVDSYYNGSVSSDNMKMWKDKRSSGEKFYSRKLLTIHTTGPGIVRVEVGVDNNAPYETVPLEKFGHISNDLPNLPLNKMYKDMGSLWRRNFAPRLDAGGESWVNTPEKSRRASIG